LGSEVGETKNPKLNRITPNVGCDLFCDVFVTKKAVVVGLNDPQAIVGFNKAYPLRALKRTRREIEGGT